MSNNKDREQFEEFMDIFTRLYSNTMKELAKYERKENEVAKDVRDAEDRHEIRKVMDKITDVYKEAISELNSSKIVKSDEKPVKRPGIPRNPNRRPTKVNADLSLARMRENNRRAIEDIFRRW
ncbi:hypothetical protein [Jeotgalibacillus terrae]|uniref:Uncharacterized protein n=1 Tax=Jeotgalibacillus terrae TaxID=587735 RepID=A0ABW5ZKP1_9BACL|nr:hypothetical protein [Jeotgalibacillus terrae]MBM7578241.1 uncharacterized UPF0160 family protein [Jeotgalibacillus terrae]